MAKVVITIEDDHQGKEVNFRAEYTPWPENGTPIEKLTPAQGLGMEITRYVHNREEAIQKQIEREKKIIGGDNNLNGKREKK